MNPHATFCDVSAAEAADLIAQNSCIVIDVRTRPEFVRHRIAEAKLLPMQELPVRARELPPHPERPYLIVCEHGVRSVAVCEFLHFNGYEGLLNLRGGMAAWMHSGFPVISGEAALEQ